MCEHVPIGHMCTGGNGIKWLELREVREVELSGDSEADHSSAIGKVI